MNTKTRATIQNLERERDALKQDYERVETQIRQFKVEKQHVVEVRICLFLSPSKHMYLLFVLQVFIKYVQ